jgi:hypothetical protein
VEGRVALDFNVFRIIHAGYVLHLANTAATALIAVVYFATPALTLAKTTNVVFLETNVISTEIAVAMHARTAIANSRCRIWRFPKRF